MDNLNEYRWLSMKLREIQQRNDFHDSVEEDLHLEKMDLIWSKLTKHEIDLLRTMNLNNLDDCPYKA